MKTNEQRINNIIGQLEGIKKMLGQGNRDCSSLIIQLKAIKSAMASLMEKIIAEEFVCCLAGKQAEEKDKIEKIFKELINN